MRDLLHLVAIVVVTGFVSWLIGSTIVGAIAALIDAWRENQRLMDQDLIDAATIRASRGEVGDVR
jgi:hypothetical protein